MKKILFDVGHPAQVHNFKHIYWELEKQGWQGLFVTKDKEICVELLEKYKLPFVVLNKNQKGLIKKIANLAKDTFRFLKIVQEFKADIILNRMSLHSTLVAKLLGVSQISLADTERSLNFSFLTDTILTANSFKKDFGSKHLRYDANIELFYLHPNRFEPNETIFNDLGIQKGEKYAIVRFVSWNAHHDVGQGGFLDEEKIKLIEQLSKELKVFISSEIELPKELQKYQITIPIEKIHDALYFAHLYIGEGASMALEAAMLATPAVYVNSLNSAGIFKELEEAGLFFIMPSGKEAISKALDLAKKENKSEFQEKSKAYIKNKIDVTAFLVWFIQNYPKSIEIVKNNPNYQKRFQ